MKFESFVYNNLEEFLTDVENTPKNLLRSSADYSHWSGANSFEDASSIVRGNVDLSKLEGKITEMETVGTMQMEAVHDVAGAVVDVGAYLEGIPENMIDFPLVDNKKFIQLYVDVCENSGVGSDEIVNKAAAASYLIDLLESDYNYRVELSVFYPVSKISGNRNMVTSVKVKRFQEKLSIGQLYGCMAPCFQRVMMFRHNEKYATPVNSGYGKIIGCDFREALKTVADTSVEIVYLPGSLHSSSLGHRANFITKEGAMEWANYFLANRIDLTKGNHA